MTSNFACLKQVETQERIEVQEEDEQVREDRVGYQPPINIACPQMKTPAGTVPSPSGRQRYSFHLLLSLQFTTQMLQVLNITSLTKGSLAHSPRMELTFI